MRTKFVVVAAALGVLLTGCTPQEPIVAEVAYKVVEGPRVEDVCNGSVNLICGENEIPASYRIKLVWEPRGDSFWHGKDEGEKWCEVDPHQYSFVEVGEVFNFTGYCSKIDWQSAQ